MDRFTIANAVEILEQLRAALTSAYWDASDVFQKDTVFEFLSTINSELNELNKLSIEDHYMDYEPVTTQIPLCSKKFGQLQKNIDAWFPRASTATYLHAALEEAKKLVLG